jgi:hypothetical protein
MSCNITKTSPVNAIKTLQTWLHSQTYDGGKPYYNANIDGGYGNYTTGALIGTYKGGVMLWQKHHGLVADGKFGPITSGLAEKKYGFNCPKTNTTTTSKPVITPNTTKSTVRSTIEGVIGTYNDIYSLINRMKSAGMDWTNYNSDVYNFAEEVRRIANHLKMNCSDLTQVFAIALKDLGYKVNYIQVRCTKGTHIILETWVNGKKYWVDISAMLHNGYEFGTGWCYRHVDDNEKLVARNPAWLMKDDGEW